MRLTRRRTLAAWAIAVGALSAGAVVTHGDLDGDDASAVSPAPVPPGPGAAAPAPAPAAGETAAQPPAPTSPTETGATPPAAPAPAATETGAAPAATPASVTVAVAGFPVTVTGTLPDAAARDEAVEHLRATYGLPRVIDRLVVDPAAGEAAWLPAFLAALPGPNASFEALTISSDGSRLVLEGEAPDAATRKDVVARARSAASPPLAVVDRLTVAPPPPPPPPTETGAAPTETAAPEPAEPAAPAATSPKALQRRLDQRLAGTSISFEPGSATLTSDGERALERIVRPLQRATGVVVEVQGHTDSQGGAPGNLLLSQDRAEAVVAFLVERGVPIGLLAAKGYGETRPVASNDTEDGKARNRRIELVVGKADADVG